ACRASTIFPLPTPSARSPSAGRCDRPPRSPLDKLPRSRLRGRLRAACSISPYRHGPREGGLITSPLDEGNSNVKGPMSPSPPLALALSEALTRPALTQFRAPSTLRSLAIAIRPNPRTEQEFPGGGRSARVRLLVLLRRRRRPWLAGRGMDLLCLD